MALRGLRACDRSRPVDGHLHHAQARSIVGSHRHIHDHAGEFLDSRRPRHRLSSDVRVAGGTTGTMRCRLSRCAGRSCGKPMPSTSTEEARRDLAIRTVRGFDRSRNVAEQSGASQGLAGGDRVGGRAVVGSDARPALRRIAEPSGAVSDWR